MLLKWNTIMNEEIRLYEKVTLNKAVMIIGLSGWGNAGQVSTYSLKYLIDKIDATKFGEIQSDFFHNYQIQRPMVSISKGTIQSYLLPENYLFYSRDKQYSSDLIFLLGSEPHHHWSKYARTLLKLAEEMGVKKIYTIGGYLADINHNTTPLITASTNNKDLLTDIEKANVTLTNYKGPTSIYSEILWQAQIKSINAISLWSAVPLHIGGLYPTAVYYIVKKASLLIGIDIDLNDLKKKVESFDEHIAGKSTNHHQLQRIDDYTKGRDIGKELSYIS